MLTPKTPYRIALATPPMPASIADGMDQVETLARQAAADGAKILCFPESYIPGYRYPGEPIPPHSPKDLEAALERACLVARENRIALVLPMDWSDRDSGPNTILNLAWVISPEGQILGRQTKNQLDPTEDDRFTPGDRRQLFTIGELTFGVALCHEAFRYPETVRWAARQGAQVVFHPHCAGTDYTGTGRRLTEWRHRDNPYYEQAMMCRALENTLYFASVNYYFEYQESASTVVGPAGEHVAHQPYGQPGVLVAEIDLAKATGLLARRFRPEALGFSG